MTTRQLFSSIVLLLLIAPVLQTSAAQSSSDAARIQGKLQQVFAEIDRWVQQGRDPSPIGKVLNDQIDPLLKQGKIYQAETLIDEILLQLTGASSTDKRESPGPVMIPSDAALVFHRDGFIFTMNFDGSRMTQITFDTPRHYEHVAVSHDRRFIAANEQRPNSGEIAGGNSRIWLYDLSDGTETQVVPHFLTAGNGGVAWDRDGFVYFAAKERDPYPRPMKKREYIANAGANEVYRIRYDGTGLERLTDTPGRGESDVGVSEDGRMVSYNSLTNEDDGNFMEIWAMRSNGSDRRMAYRMRVVHRHSAHDPELYAGNSRIVFSLFNNEVEPNWACPGSTCRPEADTAHDLYSVNLDGTDLRLLTAPGPISIIPNVKGNFIAYTELNERDQYLGAAVFDLRNPLAVRRIAAGGQAPKWIP